MSIAEVVADGQALKEHSDEDDSERCADSVLIYTKSVQDSRLSL